MTIKNGQSKDLKTNGYKNTKNNKEILEIFRDDYKEWSEQGFENKWMREYESQYRSFISL